MRLKNKIVRSHTGEKLPHQMRRLAKQPWGSLMLKLEGDNTIYGSELSECMQIYQELQKVWGSMLQATRDCS